LAISIVTTSHSEALIAARTLHRNSWQITFPNLVVIRMVTAKSKPEVKRRRSKEEIAAEKAAKEERRLGRAAEQARREEAAAAIRADLTRADYDRRLAHEAERRRQRLFQEAGIEWIMDYDTPAAKLFGKYVESYKADVARKAQKAQRAGDPLGLIVDPQPLSKKEKKAVEKKAEAERLERGERREVIPDLENPRQNVVVTSLPHSFRRAKLQIHQEPAAEKFVSDWESAGFSGLRSQGFDPKVDSSAKLSSGHMRAAEAQARIKLARDQIGQRNFDICIGVLIHNLNPSKVHALGGRDNRSVSSDIEVALNALAGFYDPVRLEKDPTWKAFRKVLEAGQSVIAQLEDEVR
jgi:hypothetical protein